MVKSKNNGKYGFKYEIEFKVYIEFCNQIQFLSGEYLKMFNLVSERYDMISVFKSQSDFGT